MGDAGVLFLRLFRRGFEFLVRIDPAHVFTFFFFLLVFRSTRFDGAAGSSGLAEELSGTCSVEDVAESASLGGVSDELALTGRERVGELLPRKGSRPKKDHLLGVLEGLGVDGALRSGAGRAASSGIEILLRGEGS